MVLLLRKIILVTVLSRVVNCGIQRITVTGRLLCHGKPIGFLDIKLLEEDLLYNDVIDDGKTDMNGHFKLSGRDEEFSAIDPFIEFKYKCSTDKVISTNDIKQFFVPSSVFRYLGYVRQFEFNFGDIDLEKIQKKFV
uniref:Transthyretin-like family protein n=1 Tax=Parastrongyloides trichosuri TaxID=131310 RepID=A0A0N4ZG68_PARTI